MIPFLLLTAFTVSIDSLVCGFSLSCGRKNKYSIVVIIALTVYLMCLITNYLTTLFSDLLTQKTACVGGLILIIIGIANLLKKDAPLKQNNLLQYFTAGFAVGLDGAFANFSLAIMGINAFYVPIIIALMHAIMLTIGISISNFKFAKKLSSLSFFAPLVLIVLGFYKILGVFI